MFALKPQSASVESTQKLDELYRQYEKKILFKLNGMEDKKHAMVCKGKTGTRRIGGVDWCLCRTNQEEIHEWEDWAIDNFGKPEEEMNWIIKPSVYSKVAA